MNEAIKFEGMALDVTGGPVKENEAIVSAVASEDHAMVIAGRKSEAHVISKVPESKVPESKVSESQEAEDQAVVVLGLAVDPEGQAE